MKRDSAAWQRLISFGVFLCMFVGVAVLLTGAVGNDAVGSRGGVLPGPVVDRLSPASATGSATSGSTATREDRPKPTTRQPRVTHGAGPRPVSMPELQDPVRVLFYGDSLGYEIRPYVLTGLTRHGRALVKPVTFPGLALCDQLRFLQHDVRTFRPQVVVFETVGSTATPCTLDPRTGRPYVRPSALDLAALQAQVAARDLAARGIRTYWVVTPPTPSGPNPLGEALRRVLAPVGGAAVVDATPAVAPGGVFRATLPCVLRDRCDPDEARTGVRVRAADGLHFCPVRHNSLKPCPVYSAGAQRFGSTVAELIATDLEL